MDTSGATLNREPAYSTAAQFRPGDAVTVRAFKSDGHAYRWWTASVEIIDDDSVITLSRAGHRVYGPQGGWVSAFDLRTIYWFERPFNLVEVYRPDGKLKQVYIHIASPARLDGNVLCYTDLELDVVWRPGRRPRLVDEQEFCAAAREYGYSAQFQKDCRRAANQALRLVRSWKPQGPPCESGLDGSIYSHCNTADILQDP